MLTLRPLSIPLCALALCAGCTSRSLDIYFIDMVGGAATLIVTPQRESVLIDAGSLIQRDADRIQHVLRDVAGLSRIDHMIVTHWHLDHYGAIGLLEERIILGRFYDRGIPDEVPEDPEHFPELIAAYKKVTKGQSVTLRAGDEIALQRANGPRLRLRCLMADGQVEPGQSAGADPNPYCDQHCSKRRDETENGKSIVLLLSFGEFDFFAGGDITWNIEKKLVCPVNRAGKVELFQVNHHGLSASNNPVLVHALAPKAAVMLNGPRKGCAATVVETLRTSEGFEDLWPLHRNHRTSAAHNAPRSRIANPDDPEGGRFVKVSVEPSGAYFTVRIGRTGERVRYRCWP